MGIITRTGRVHPEQHFTGSEIIRDIVIGMADGLTVPFALIAGLSGAFNSNSIVIVGGLAEIAAGSIAMGLGGYLAARTDSEHYASEREREVRETVELPDVEQEEVAKVFRDYGLDDAQMAPVVTAICADQKLSSFICSTSWNISLSIVLFMLVSKTLVPLSMAWLIEMLPLTM